MKRRHGFVSNSSSSSFIIARTDMSDLQVQQIRDHASVGAALGLNYADQPWTIEVTGTEVRGWTNMDNFSMKDFLSSIGVGSICPDCGRAVVTVEWDYS